MLPLFPQFLCAVAERISQQLIKLDSDCLPALARLQGKQLAITLPDFKLTLVISASKDTLLFNQHDEAVDCRITANISTLKQLRDPSQLTRLIKADALKIDGDLQVAQLFSQFIQQLNPDWQSALAQYIGDAQAHKLGRTLEQLQRYLQYKTKQLAQLHVELAQDELLLTPSREETEHFNQQLNELQARVELLRRQLSKLQE